MDNIFEEYALLESQEKAIKLKKEQLRPFILEKMIKDGINKLDTVVGKFTVEKRKTWTYPERISNMEEELKAEKALAQSTKEATYEETEGLKFISIKL